RRGVPAGAGPARGRRPDDGCRGRHGPGGGRPLRPEGTLRSAGAGMTQLGERTAEGSDRASANVLEFPDTASRAHRRHRRLWWITGAAATLLVAVLGAVLYFSPVLAVTTVTVTGT